MMTKFFSAVPIIPMSAFVSFERLLNSFFRQNIAETEMYYDSFGQILMSFILSFILFHVKKLKN